MKNTLLVAQQWHAEREYKARFRVALCKGIEHASDSFVHSLVSSVEPVRDTGRSPNYIPVSGEKRHTAPSASVTAGARNPCLYLRFD
eukprot:scaffold279447_cov28-Attheya_sp.AAC.1